MGVVSFNRNPIGDAATEEDLKSAAFARNDEGEVVGGVRAVAFWNWLHIDLEWVKKDYRGTGIGQRLLASAEEFAVTHGSYRSRLETTGFQALEFYQKQGYVIFGELDDLPNWELMFTRSLFDTPDMVEQGKLLNEVAALVDAGRIRSTVTEIAGKIDAETLREVHARIESGSARGKIVLEGF